MARAKCRFFRADVRAAWKLLLDMGEKPVTVKFSDDGASFRIITEAYVKAKYGEPTKAAANEWDAVYEPAPN